MVYKYRVRGHPTTFFIDKNGVLTRIVAGLTTPQMLQTELDKLLK
jgi:thioredoxin-related protein